METQKIADKVQIIGRYNKINLIYVDVTNLRNFNDENREEYIASGLKQAKTGLARNLEKLGVHSVNETEIEFILEETVLNYTVL